MFALVRPFCALLVLSALSPAAVMARSGAAAPERYRLDTRVERSMPDGETRVLLHASSGVTLSQAGSADHMSLAKSNDRGVDANGKTISGLDVFYWARPNAEGRIEVWVTLFFSEPVLPAWNPGTPPVSVSDGVRLNRMLEDVLGHDVVVEDKDPLGPLRFVFRLEPIDPI